MADSHSIHKIEALKRSATGKVKENLDALAGQPRPASTRCYFLFEDRNSSLYSTPNLSDIRDWFDKGLLRASDFYWLEDGHKIFAYGTIAELFASDIALFRQPFRYWSVIWGALGVVALGGLCWVWVASSVKPDSHAEQPIATPATSPLKPVTETKERISLEVLNPCIDAGNHFHVQVRNRTSVPLKIVNVSWSFYGPDGKPVLTRFLGSEDPLTITTTLGDTTIQPNQIIESINTQNTADKEADEIAKTATAEIQIFMRREELAKIDAVPSVPDEGGTDTIRLLFSSPRFPLKTDATVTEVTKTPPDEEAAQAVTSTWTPPTESQADGGPVTVGSYLASQSLDMLERAESYVAQRDDEALQKLIDSGDVFILKSGIRVEVMDTKGIFSQLVKIRPRGETIEIWTVAEAIRGRWSH